MSGWTDMNQKESPDCLSGQDEGESPLFPPQHETAEEARLEILHVIRREPYLFGFQQSRWTLKSILETCDWLRISTAGGLHRLLERIGIRYKQGREYLRSPDRHYEDKLSLIQLCGMRAFYAPQQYVFLYGDQMTFFRQPSVARAYEVVGHRQPLARRAYSINTRSRLMGAMNAFSGQLTYEQRSRTNVPALVSFMQRLIATYPDAEMIYVVLDNWPVHYHPNLIAHLQSQQFPWPPKLPRRWPTEPTVHPKHEPWPIQLLFLPTYASWSNPIEKLWRWLKQSVIHMHRLANDWPKLKQRVNEFLDQFQEPSDELLKYVGLLPD